MAEKAGKGVWPGGRQSYVVSDVGGSKARETIG